MSFFFNDTATTEIYTLPYTTLFRSDVSRGANTSETTVAASEAESVVSTAAADLSASENPCADELRIARSEEHTSELQSRQYLVCRLLLEKKNKTHLVFILI